MPSFSGGPVLLAQWVQDARDRDVTCPLLHGRADAPNPLTALLGTTLRRGDSGSAVTALQRAMLMRPQYVTGRFDLRTEQVLLALQRSRGLPLTGVATEIADLQISRIVRGQVLAERDGKVWPGFDDEVIFELGIKTCLLMLTQEGEAFPAGPTIWRAGHSDGKRSDMVT